MLHVILFHIEILDFCFNNAVGIASPDVIPDDHVTASSQDSEIFQAAYGRLYGDRGDGWCAKEPNKTDDWLQVDLARTIQVCAVATQGDRGINGFGSLHEWVTHFKLSYSTDGNSWTTYNDGNDTEMVFKTLFYSFYIMCVRNMRNRISFICLSAGFIQVKRK